MILWAAPSRFLLATLRLLVGWACLMNAAGAQEPPLQPVVEAPLPPQEAARTMIVPEGFRVTLFAGEPDCRQPISFCIDDRGRLWVAEAYNYPRHGTTPGDRIVILEDQDGDGMCDKRTVFFDGLNYVTGVEVGFGGAWVMSPPYFYFIPDHDRDDIPDGPPELLLDGFGNHANAHNLANGFAWGPDGWLYGTHGRTNWSLIGKPGTPDDQRQRFDGGVYRFHPVTRVWEPYADGTTNPWGIDWNDVGEAFVCNCVNPHLFHVIPGAHYEPWRNRPSSQFAYRRIPTIADHLHFIGRGTVQDGLGTAEEDAAGGGHAHCGTMIYLGDNWPEEYRDTLFTNNIHGKRINNDLPRRFRSGYSAAHGRDLMRSRDPWFMGVTLGYGPDGGVFVSDWSDTGECHSVTNTRRETGRIFKIMYGPSAPSPPVDLARLDDRELVELQTHRNDWQVRHARRLLQERAAAASQTRSGRAAPRDAPVTPAQQEAARRLHALFKERQEPPVRLRALWALYGIGALEESFLRALLEDENESICAWAVRLLCDQGQPSAAALEQFERLSATVQSPLVRLHLASNLQRLSAPARWPIAEALALREEDADDPNLPLMIWYGVEPLVEDDPARFLRLAGQTRIPLLARHVCRRVVSIPDAASGLAGFVELLATVPAARQAELLAGALEGLEGRRRVSPPAAWSRVHELLQGSDDEAVRERGLQLALIFNDPRALAALRAIALDADASPDPRNRALQSLVASQADEVAPLLLELVDDPATRQVAIRGLAAFNHPATQTHLLERYLRFDPPARLDILQTLASRAPWSMALLDAVETGKIPRGDLTAYTARQMNSLGDPRLKARVLALWGELRTSPGDKTRLIARYKARLTAESLQQGNRSQGRAVFQKLCANCHRLFDAGGTIGPDLTGAQRTSLDYLLQTLVDPSAAVARDYQMQIIETTGGRTITGLIVDESPAAITLQTVNERMVVLKSDIENQAASPASMMPEGMLSQLSNDQIRDLLAYLMGPEQAPLSEPREQP